MDKIEYNHRETSLTHFMDQFTIQRLERIISFESQCTPSNKELIASSLVLIKHLKSIWDMK
jgi:hypothetical protein